MPPKFSRQTDEKRIFPEWDESQPRTSPCEAHCPAGNPIQKISTLIAAEAVDEALSYVLARNPFPGITGRVCSHPCEEDCNRDLYDQAVSIKALERFAADHSDRTRIARPKKRSGSGKTVAVIGAGPAGLTCAYFLALFGHEVTIFEAAPVPGGIPRLAIPDFRLPKDVAEREISVVFELGVKARFNTKVGRDVEFGSIVNDYDACVIATGTGKERRLDVPGAEFAVTGVSFLNQVSLGWKGPVGRNVVIAGGGGVAFDCALTAKRLGAPTVTIVCLEGNDSMCASAEDILLAQTEGIEVLHSCLITSIPNNGANATGVEYVGVSSFSFDGHGCLLAGSNTSETGTVIADTVISAIGVLPDVDFLGSDRRFPLTSRGTVPVDVNSSTGVVKVFAAGDVVSGPSMVAAAIGSGRRAAVAVDRYLRGDAAEKATKIAISPTGDVVLETLTALPRPPHVVTFEEILNVDFHEKGTRQEAERPESKPASHVAVELEGGLGADAAAAEAGRCFHCGHCTSCGNCVTDCPLYVLSMAGGRPEVTHFDECWHCGCCRIACPSSAVLYEFPLNMLV
jgi:formate dehydrogenase (NADP+) beta subunit